MNDFDKDIVVLIRFGVSHKEKQIYFISESRFENRLTD